MLRLENFLESLMKSELVQDAVVSQSAEQEKHLWTIREDLPLCLMQLSRSSSKTDADVVAVAVAVVDTQCIKLYKYDVSLSLRDTEAMVLLVKKEMSEVTQHTEYPLGLNLEYCCFGHAGDENLHLNILMHVPSTYDLESREKLKDSIQIVLNNAVFKAVISFKGSVSAEHGVGQQKKEIMNKARSPAELSLMASIKKSLDPNGILNPGKVLPDSYC